MIECKTCKKDFYPYLGSRVFCSMKCYKENKHLDNITRWKENRTNHITAGKLCRRCKELFNPEFSNSRYCSTCKEILMDTPKKKLSSAFNRNKLCKDCRVEMPNVNLNKLYCDDCKVIRTAKNVKKNHLKNKAKLRADTIKRNVKSSSKTIDPKWLVRGTPSGGSRACAISQEV